LLTEIEAVMNSLISLIILVPDCEELVNLFCQTVGAIDEKSQWSEVRLRVYVLNMVAVFLSFSDVQRI